MKVRSQLILAAIAALVAIPSAQAQLLYDFEAGIAGVSPQDANTSVAHSVGIGATGGSTGALQATKENGQGFAWVANIQTIGNAPVVDAIQAAYANPTNKFFLFDVTVDPTTMPQWANFVNGEMVVNSENDGFRQAAAWGLGGGDTAPTTLTASVPLTALHGGNIPGGNWLELWFSVNGDWGTAPGSIYIDNIRLIPEPMSAALFCMGVVAVLGAARRRRS